MPTQRKPKWQQEFEKKAHQEIVKKKKRQPNGTVGVLSGYSGSYGSSRVVAPSFQDMRALRGIFDDNLSAAQQGINSLSLARAVDEAANFHTSTGIKRRLLNLKYFLRNFFHRQKVRVESRLLRLADRWDIFYTVHLHRHVWRMRKFQIKHNSLMWFVRRIIIYFFIVALIPKGWKFAVLMILYFLIDFGAFLNRGKIPMTTFHIDEDQEQADSGILVDNRSGHDITVEIYPREEDRIIV